MPTKSLRFNDNEKILLENWNSETSKAIKEFLKSRLSPKEKLNFEIDQDAFPKYKRLEIIQEKKNLLRHLRSCTIGAKTLVNKERLDDLQNEIYSLISDLGIGKIEQQPHILAQNFFKGMTKIGKKLRHMIEFWDIRKDINSKLDPTKSNILYNIDYNELEKEFTFLRISTIVNNSELMKLYELWKLPIFEDLYKLFIGSCRCNSSEYPCKNCNTHFYNIVDQCIVVLVHYNLHGTHIKSSENTEIKIKLGLNKGQYKEGK